jgi:hypothetical protein
MCRRSNGSTGAERQTLLEEARSIDQRARIGELVAGEVPLLELGSARRLPVEPG